MLELFATSPVLVVAALVVVLAIVVLGRRLDVKIGNIHAQLTPNGGKSLRDAIDRVERKADNALAQIRELRELPPPAPPVALAVVAAPPTSEAPTS